MHTSRALGLVAALALAAVTWGEPTEVVRGDLAVQVWEIADYHVDLEGETLRLRRQRLGPGGEPMVDAARRPVLELVDAAELSRAGRERLGDIRKVIDLKRQNHREFATEDGRPVDQGYLERAGRNYRLVDLRPASPSTPGFSELSTALDAPAVQEALHQVRLAELARGEVVGDAIPDVVLRPRPPPASPSTFYMNTKRGVHLGLGHATRGCEMGRVFPAYEGAAAWEASQDAVLGIHNRRGEGAFRAQEMAEVLPHEIGHAYEVTSANRAETYLDPFARSRRGEARPVARDVRAGIADAGGPHFEYQSYEGPISLKEAYAHFTSWASGNLREHGRWETWEQHRRRLSEMWDGLWIRESNGRSHALDAEGNPRRAEGDFGDPLSPDAEPTSSRAKVRPLERMLRTEGVVASILIDFSQQIDALPEVEGRRPFDGRQVVREVLTAHTLGGEGMVTYEHFRAEVHKLFPELAVELFVAEAKNTLNARLDAGGATEKAEMLELLREGRVAEVRGGAAGRGSHPAYLASMPTDAEGAYRVLREQIARGAREVFFATSRTGAPSPREVQEGRRRRARLRASRALGAARRARDLYLRRKAELASAPPAEREARVVELREALSASQLFLERARVAARAAGQTSRAEVLYPRLIQQVDGWYGELRAEARRLEVREALLPEGLREARLGPRAARPVPARPTAGRGGPSSSTGSGTPAGGEPAAASTGERTGRRRAGGDLRARIDDVRRSRREGYRRFVETFQQTLRTHPRFRALAGHANFFAATYALTLYRLASTEPDQSPEELLSRAGELAFSPEAVGAFLLFLAVDRPFHVAASELGQLSSALAQAGRRAGRVLLRVGARAVGAAGTFAALFVTEGAIQGMDVISGEQDARARRQALIDAMDTEEGRRAQVIAREFFDLGPHDVLREAFDPDRMDYWRLAAEGGALVAASLGASATGQVWLAPWAALAAAAAAGHAVDLARARDFQVEDFRAEIRERRNDAVGTSSFERLRDPKWAFESLAGDVTGDRSLANTRNVSLKVKESSLEFRNLTDQAARELASLVSLTETIRGKTLEVAVYSHGMSRYFQEITDAYSVLERRQGTDVARLRALHDRLPRGFHRYSIVEEPESSMLRFYNTLVSNWATNVEGRRGLLPRSTDTRPMVPLFARELNGFFGAIREVSPRNRGPVLRATPAAAMVRTAWMHYQKLDVLLRYSRQILTLAAAYVDGLVRAYGERGGILEGFTTVLDIQRGIEVERQGALEAGRDAVARELGRDLSGDVALDHARVMWQFVLWPWRQGLGSTPEDELRFQREKGLRFQTLQAGALRVYGQSGEAEGR